MIRFCNRCGADVSHVVPAGDSLPRHVCNSCGYIHYENPRLVVGCVAEWEGRILLCRRAIEPQRGFWTLPAGFMENGETTAQAASRETMEEAGASIILDAPFAMVSIAHINQVHLFYRGRLATPAYAAGVESLEVLLLNEEDIPWQDLAFRSVTLCLEHYLADRASGTYGFHETELTPLVFSPINRSDDTEPAR
ncbi:NUDIX hydrolase [Dechloromonas denitrificans]|uniref:NUDIX hydrolase n=1 Tax=Dechloromonas denitrificans TaxID=281362 RepID=UPI00299CFDFE|nr:NUDIX hydrolase [Dechloromonas denitrificans]